MTEAELDEIEACYGFSPIESFREVPALVAEVRKLRGLLARVPELPDDCWWDRTGLEAKRNAALEAEIAEALGVSPPGGPPSGSSTG